MTRSSLLRKLRIMPDSLICSGYPVSAPADVIRSQVLRYAADAAPDDEIRKVNTLFDVCRFAQLHANDYNGKERMI